MYFGFIFLILSITISLLVTNVCTCEELQSENDCTIGESQCDWDKADESCGTTPCSHFDGNDDECIKFVGCAVNDVGNCREFTDCVDYHVKNAADCPTKWPTCVMSTTKNETDFYQCQEDEINYNYGVCDKANETVCVSQTQADGKICDWDSKSKQCAAYDANRCSNIISEQKCHNNCTWKEDICRAPYCSEMNETLCTYLRGDLIGTFQICRWDQTEKSCFDADDGITVLDFLNVSNCLINTFFTATWNGTYCLLCQDGQSSVIFLGLATTLLLV